MLKTWQGLQGMLKGLPSDMVPVTSVNTLSDAALQASIDAQLTSVDNNADIPGQRAAMDPNGAVPNLSNGNAFTAKPGARSAAINALKTAVASPATADLGQFHAVLGAYSDQLELTVPDFKFDDIITDSERIAAEQIAARLEAGETAPQIRAAFTAQGATIQQQQAAAAKAEADRKAAEEAARIQQSNLQGGVDAHLAAMGYIKADQIGLLTAQQRANWVTQFMIDRAPVLTRDGSASNKYGDLGQQQAAAVNMGADYGVNPAALEILNAGRAGEQMQTEVKAWLESGDVNQIKMAQATLGISVTGVVDNATYTAGAAYITKGVATSLSGIPHIQNVTGSINPSLTWKAANEGSIYIPTVEELRAAGLSEAQLEMIAAAKPASEILSARQALSGKPRDQFTEADKDIWVQDTREELIANAYINDPALYTRVTTAHNAALAGQTLNVSAPASAAAQQQEFVANYNSIPVTVASADPNAITMADGRVFADLPPGVKDMFEAKRAVEEAERSLQQVNMQTGGFRTDPQTGQEYYYDLAQERLKAEAVADSTYVIYDAKELELRQNGTFGTVMEYIRKIETGEIQPSPPAGNTTTPQSDTPAVDTEILTSSTRGLWVGTENIDVPVGKGDRLFNADGSFNGTFNVQTDQPTGAAIAIDQRFQSALDYPNTTADPEFQAQLDAYAARMRAQMTNGNTPGLN